MTVPHRTQAKPFPCSHHSAVTVVSWGHTGRHHRIPGTGGLQKSCHQPSRASWLSTGLPLPPYCSYCRPLAVTTPPQTGRCVCRFRFPGLLTDAHNPHSLPQASAWTGTPRSCPPTASQALPSRPGLLGCHTAAPRHPGTVQVLLILRPLDKHGEPVSGQRPRQLRLEAWQECPDYSQSGEAK